LNRKNMKCLRCGGEMSHAMRNKIQLGQTSWIFGDWPNLLAGAMEVDVYSCKECAKLEFFIAEDVAEYGEIAQKKCPKCGKSHDMDYPKCPFCKYDYIERDYIGSRMNK